MAKKRTATATQETALFPTEQYSQGIGDTERSLTKDSYWDEIVLDSGITQTELNGQTTLFYDSTSEPPTLEEFDSLEAYNAAYDSWRTNHPELINHGFKSDSEDKGFKVGDRLLSDHPLRKGEIIVEEYPYYGADNFPDFNFVCTTQKLQIHVKYLSKPSDEAPQLKDSSELLRDSLKVGDRIFSKHFNREGEIINAGKTGCLIQWKGWIKSAYSYIQVEELQLSKIEDKKPCLPCSTVMPEQVQPPLQVTNLESELANLSKLTPQRNEFSSTDSQISPSIQTSEIIKGNSNGIASTGSVFPVPEQATPETVQDLNTQNQECGSIVSERSQLNSLNLLLLSSPEELLTTDLEQFLEDLEWSNIVGKIQKSYQLRNSAHPTNESEFSLLPTPTTYPKGSGKCRPAGTNRLEQKLRPFIHKGDKLHPAAAGWMMGFDPGWVEQPLADTGDLLSIQVPFIPVQDTTLKTGESALTFTAEPLPHNKQKSHSEELNISQNSQDLQVDTLVRILEGRYKGEYGIVREIQEESIIVYAFSKSIIVKNGNFAIASKLKLENYQEGSYLLNGRVGRVIESYDLQYFVLQYSDVAKCYFWGQDDEFIKGLAIAPQELVEKFLGENLDTAPQELVEKFLGENLDTAPQELVEKFLGENLDIAPQELVEKFLGENTNTSQVSPKKKKVASGSLAPYLENKKLKDGQIVTYPRVTGEREKLNHLHWKWGYYYEIKIDGEWKNRSLPTPARIVPQVKILIENHRSIEEIKDFILQSKHKKGGN
jgi:hypothetical protein